MRDLSGAPRTLTFEAPIELHQQGTISELALVAAGENRAEEVVTRVKQQLLAEGGRELLQFCFGSLSMPKTFLLEVALEYGQDPGCRNKTYTLHAVLHPVKSMRTAWEVVP